MSDQKNNDANFGPERSSSELEATYLMLDDMQLALNEDAKTGAIDYLSGLTLAPSAFKESRQSADWNVVPHQGELFNSDLFARTMADFLNPPSEEHVRRLLESDPPDLLDVPKNNSMSENHGSLMTGGLIGWSSGTIPLSRMLGHVDPVGSEVKKGNSPVAMNRLTDKEILSGALPKPDLSQSAALKQLGITKVWDWVDDAHYDAEGLDAPQLWTQSQPQVFKWEPPVPAWKRRLKRVGLAIKEGFVKMTKRSKGNRDKQHS